MLIVYRDKTGCRQYIFENYTDFVRHFTKDCYEGERFLVTEFDDDGAHVRKFRTSTHDFIYGCGVQLDLFRHVGDKLS